MRCRALLLLLVQKRHSDCPRITSVASQPFAAAIGTSAANVLGARSYCPAALAGEPALEHPAQHTAFDSVAATTGGIAARVLDDLSPPLSSASCISLLPLLRRHLKVGAMFGTYEGWAAKEELRLRSLLELLASAGADQTQLQDFIAGQAAISWQESALIRWVGWLAARTCALHCPALIAAGTLAYAVAWPMLTSAKICESDSCSDAFVRPQCWPLMVSCFTDTFAIGSKAPGACLAHRRPSGPGTPCRTFKTNTACHDCSTACSEMWTTKWW